MKKFDPIMAINSLVGVLIIALVVFFLYSYFTGTFGKTALQVAVQHGNARVYINEKDFGDAPVYSEGMLDYKLKVRLNGDQNEYITEIQPSRGTIAIVNRDLGVSDTFSSGQNLWMIKNVNSDHAYVNVIAPKDEGVTIFVNDVEVGKSPLKFSEKDILKQNDEHKYTFRFKKDGYEEQTITANLIKGYQLNIKVDLFLNPIPTETSLAEGFPEGVKFINLSKVTNPQFINKKDWAKAINYWLSTRPNYDVFGNYKISKFDFFIDDVGNIYNSDGNLVERSSVKPTKDTAIAYLGFTDNIPVSESAKQAINEIIIGSPDVANTDTNSANTFKVKIQPTGLGFLRVRESNTTTAKEIGRVNENQEYTATEEKAGWYKIKFDNDTKEGWVTGTYAKKVSQ